MDDDPLFPLHASLEKEFIEEFYFTEEYEFLPSPDLFDHRNLRERRAQAIKKIVQLTRDRNYNVFIPYMAMNYYDRYVSWNPTPSRRKNSKYAICCLILALKMRNKDFCVKDYRRAENLKISRDTLGKLELRIFKGLGWRLWSITPFSFLHFYYPRYKEIGGFKWNCIINIIIEAQADISLARYKHSEIASSSLMAAAAIAYRTEFLTNFTNDVAWSPSLCQLMQLCNVKNIAIECGDELRRPKEDEASTSRNPNDPPEADERRHGKDVASSSNSQNDSLILADDQAFSRRPGKEIMVIEEDPLAVTDDQPFTRRPGKEVMVYSSDIDYDPLAVPDDQEFSRRPGKEVMASSSEIEDNPLAVTDDQPFSRRPGKEIMVIEQDPLAVTDEQAFSRRPGKEVMAASTSEIEDDPLAVTDDQPFSRRPGKEVMTYTSEIEEDPLAVTDDQPFSRRPGKEVMTYTSDIDDDYELGDPESLLKELGFTSQTIDNFLMSTDEQEETPQSRLKKLGFTSQTIDPLFASTYEQEIPSTSGSMDIFTSQGDSSKENDELQIPNSPIQGLVSSSQTTYHPSSVTDEPENPCGSSGSTMVVPSQGHSSAVTDQLEIPRRPEKHVTFASQSGPSEVTEEQEIPRRPGKEVLTTSQEIPSRPRKEEETKETQHDLPETSQRPTKEAELARSSRLAHPAATSETETSPSFITTLQSLFDASQRSIRSLSEISELSVHTPPYLSEISGFEASQSSMGSESDNSMTQPPPPPPATHTSPASTRRNSETSRLNTCCNVL